MASEGVAANRRRDEAAGARLADVVAVLDAAYPRRLAEEWDAVGLVCGDLDAVVRSILLVVDVTEETVDEALSAGADLVVAHHPLLLRGVHGVGTDTVKGRLVHRLVRAGCALFTAHTNADNAAPGVSDALARVLGLTDLSPLAPRSVEPAADAAHPTGTGRVGTLAQPVSLQAFTEQVARVLPHTRAGVRAAGPAQAQVQRVAVCGGSGSDLVDAARRAGADVLLTADLRHHTVSDALAAGGPWLVDVAHWASEWPWLIGAREAILAGLEPSGFSPTATVSTTVTDPWTLRV